MRNLITDVPGLLVGNADDAKLASGVTAIVFDEPAVASGRRARRRAGHARDRPAAAGRDGRARRRDRAVGRLGVRARCARRRAGMAARTGPRLCDRRRASCRSCRARSCSTCINGGDKDWGRFPPYRDLGYAAAANAGADFALGTAGAGLRRHHRQPQGRARLGLGDDARRRDRRRDRRRQCGRQRHGRRRAAFLGGAVRAGRRVRRARPALAVAAATRSRSASRAACARTPPSRWSRPTRR